MSKKLIVLSVLIVVCLVYWYILTSEALTNYNNVKASVLNLKAENEKLKQLSPIEQDAEELKQTGLDYEYYKAEEQEMKELKELSKWKQRCLKKKLIWEETQCKDNLEKHADYSGK